jgi:hypothetical protein
MPEHPAQGDPPAPDVAIHFPESVMNAGEDD